MEQKRSELQDAQINKALGAFMLFFGAVIIISLFFTETLVGKMTNLAAGSVLSLIGAVMVLKGCRQKRIPPGS